MCVSAPWDSEWSNHTKENIASCDHLIFWREISKWAQEKLSNFSVQIVGSMFFNHNKKCKTPKKENIKHTILPRTFHRFTVTIWSPYTLMAHMEGWVMTYYLIINFYKETMLELIMVSLSLKYTTTIFSSHRSHSNAEVLNCHSFSLPQWFETVIHPSQTLQAIQGKDLDLDR